MCPVLAELAQAEGVCPSRSTVSPASWYHQRKTVGMEHREGKVMDTSVWVESDKIASTVPTLHATPA